MERASEGGRGGPIGPGRAEMVLCLGIMGNNPKAGTARARPGLQDGPYFPNLTPVFAAISRPTLLPIPMFTFSSYRSSRRNSPGRRPLELLFWFVNAPLV